MIDDAVRSEMMRRAIEIARRSAESGGGPFGAVVVGAEGTIVAEGANAVTASNDPTAHAEIVAVRAACAVRKTFELGRHEIFTSCEPCPMCLGAIHWARLGRIWFAADRHDAAAAGFDDDLLYREFKLPFDKRHTPIARLLAEEGKAPFEAWDRNGAKVRY